MTTIVIRPARLDDAEAVADIRNAFWQAQTGRPLTDAEATRHDWQSPDFDLARRVAVAVDAMGETVGFTWITTRPPNSIGLMLAARPGMDSAAIRGPLLAWAEARAHDLMAENPMNAPFTVYVRVAPDDGDTIRLVEGRGYTLYRLSQEMRVTLDHLPPAPRWPDGVTPTVLVPEGNERAVHAAISEAFETNWEGDRVPPFETWRYETLADVGYDPTLWVVAVDDTGEVAGAMGGTAAWRSQDDVGGLFDFGVRPAWRGRGLGRAIMLQALRQFYARGYRSVALSVDADNTPAVSLYDSIGFRPTWRSATYARH